MKIDEPIPPPKRQPSAFERIAGTVLIWIVVTAVLICATLLGAGAAVLALDWFLGVWPW